MKTLHIHSLRLSALIFPPAPQGSFIPIIQARPASKKQPPDARRLAEDEEAPELPDASVDKGNKLNIYYPCYINFVLIGWPEIQAE